MRTPRLATGCLALAFLVPLPLLAQADTNSPALLLATALARVAAVVQPPTNEGPHTFTTKLRILKADGLPQELVGRELDLAYQAPDLLRLSLQWNKDELVLGRDHQVVWLDVPGKKFGLIGSASVPRFAREPKSNDATPLEPIRLPVAPTQLLLLPLMFNYERLPAETVDGMACDVLKLTPKPEAPPGLRLPKGTLQLWLRQMDTLPLRVAYRNLHGLDVQLELIHPQVVEPWPAANWKLAPAQDEKIETVARAHVTRFLSVALAMLHDQVPSLGPATGERQVLAREGNGRLESIDGTHVLFLKGTPEEMGRQHARLLKPEIRELMDRILYGVGVGSSFEKGHWFFGEIEAAQNRLEPFIEARYLREMDALADAGGFARQEVRLANFFPELFHCSGFALFGKATEGGRMYQGRILDYLRGMGLEQHAVVMVLQPEQGNAWVNVSYAGFIGSVTAMNEKHVAIGEMGGRGEGRWDGKPMAELVREVMEKASTLEEAVEIMRRGPRTCEYYYVISDAKSKRAVGIAATPDKFETIWPGQSHPLLPHAIPDAVLVSAGDRYEELARRVKASYGKLNADSARDLMKRPVCMTSNIHSVLFAPDTLDFWVANADAQNPAAHTRYTHYNLADLLEPEKAM